jgi:hypothetical protein
VIKGVLVFGVKIVSGFIIFTTQEWLKPPVEFKTAVTKVLQVIKM